MFVYRIAKTKLSKDFSGEGAKLHGGRWNHILTPCIYTSESRALAVLEFTVNVNIDDIPKSLSLITIEIPKIQIQELTIHELPENWQVSPAPASTKDFGTNLLTLAKTAVIKFPSVVIPCEFNYLLNPQNNHFKKFKITNVEDFFYDTRIKMNK
ncbi:MAG TPA: RES family NAD+ phosphorylase [Niabella sp.]|nr:RES family NAD+ phosphorylase [Niabella sp.]HOZ96264.1 RES family NAD+ phosphorylase [Niabella sp.]HQW14662.1 RES family NAD+ phosphorylase [Niabella sp.]HQX19801.1 RES family NAD+ phosphorylase [Niabella sp.]HQX41099.1 RES family NAD+ phosphorylase [Niabella sp.]